VRQLAGQTLYLSVAHRMGADYSGGQIAVAAYTGTAGGESVSMTGTMGFTTGNNNVLAAVSSGTPSTTAARSTVRSFAVPSDALDLAFRIYYVPSGTAGAADYLEITNVKLTTDASTSFAAPDLDAVRAEALRYYRSGTFRWPAPLAGAVTQRSPTVSLGAPMRATPTVTLASPVSGSHVRDVTAGADCSATASANVGVDGFTVSCTGNASTAAGNELAVAWVADARL
jgi:hypothetical protein